MTNSLSARLHDALVNLRYPSLSWPGEMRGFMEHHIDAVMRTITPVIEQELEEYRKTLTAKYRGILERVANEGDCPDCEWEGSSDCNHDCPFYIVRTALEEL